MRISIFVLGLSVALTTLSTAQPREAAAQAASPTFRYLQARIVRVEGKGDAMRLILDAGRAAGVYEGSTGLVYLGQTANFLEDGDEKIRFEVKKVGDRESEAVVFQGDADDDDFKANVRVVLRARPTAPRCSPNATVDGERIDGCVVDRIKKWDAIIDRVAAEKGVDKNLIRGVIAAESGGDEKEVSPSGYKGLMQSSRNAADLDGKTSIESGAQNIKDKEKALRIRLTGEGIDLDSLSADSKLDAILAAYNAGQVSVHHAVKYAAAGGDKNRWADVGPFTRAVLNTGAYNAKAAFSTCMPSTPKTDMARLVAEAEAGRRALVGKDLTEAQAATKAPALTLCAAKFKATHSPRYRKRINAYRHYFEQQGKK